MAKNINVTVYYYKTMMGWRALYWGACQIYGYMESSMEEEMPETLHISDKLKSTEGLSVKGQAPADGGLRGSSILRIKQGKKKVVVLFQKEERVSGYEIAYRKGKKGNYHTIVVEASEGEQAVLRKLKPGKAYYVKVRTFVCQDGIKYVSAYSKPEKFRRKMRKL